MKATRRVGRVLKPFVNFPKWMGLGQLAANARNIGKMFQDLRVHRPVIRQETFEEAMLRLNLTEEDIRQRLRSLYLLAVIYFFGTIVFLVYTIHMIIHGRLGMIMGLLLTVLIATFAYRESFWYFQLKTRKLGNSFKDWVNFIMRGEHK